MKYYWEGLLDYDSALEKQKQAWQKIHDEKENSWIILGCEHPKVITFGVRGEPQDDLLQKASYYQEQGIALKHADRGGQATLHSPGQLVIYPIVSLRSQKIGVRKFVQLLEKITMQLLLSYEIKTEKKQEPGLYTNKGKIAFFGIKIDRGISRHGLSINVKNDLSLFSGIRSCGLQNSYPHTSMQDYLVSTNTSQTASLAAMASPFLNITVKDVFFQWCDLFQKEIFL